MNGNKRIEPGKWYNEFDENGNFLTAVYDASYYRVLGFDPAELKIREFSDWTARIHPEDVDRVLAYSMDVCSKHPEGMDYDVEYRMMTKWGYHWFHDYGHCIRRGDGSLARCDGVAFDIQDTVEKEELHRALEEYNSCMFALEDNFESLYDVDLESGTYAIYVKGDFYQKNILNKLSAPKNYFEDLRTNIDAAIYPEDREGLYRTLNKESLLRELADKEHLDYYYRVVADGRPVWLKVRAVYKNAERKNIIIGAFRAEEEVAAKKQEENIRNELINRMAGDDGVFLINCKNDTRKTINDYTRGASNYSDTDPYSESVSRYIQNCVAEADQSKMLEATSPQYMLDRTKNEKEYSVRYRDTTTGVQLFYEMRIARFSDTEVLQSFKENDRAVIDRLVFGKLRDDYYALFCVDLDSGNTKILKNDPGYFGSTGSVIAYTPMMQELSSNYDGETREFLEKLSSIDYLKQRFAEEDKATFTFKSHLKNRKRWGSLMALVLMRNIGGAPSMLALCFSYLDEDASQKEELQLKIQESMEVVGGLASEYTALYHVNLDTGAYVLYRLVQKTADIMPYYARCPKFSDLAREYAAGDLVHPDDHARMEAFFPSEDAVRKALRGKKNMSVRFRRNYGGEYLWTDAHIVKCEEAEEEAHNVIVGFLEKDEEVKRVLELQRRRKAEEEENKLIDSIVSAYNIAYRVNLSEDSFQLLRMDDNMLGHEEVFKHFSEAKEFFLSTVLHPADKERLSQELDYDMIRRKLVREKSYKTEYRAIIRGATIWHEMSITSIGEDEVVIGFALKNLEITKHHLEEKYFEEFMALFTVDFDTETIQPIKTSPLFQTAEVGEAVPYEPAMKMFASIYDGEAESYFTQISDLEYLRHEFASDDKRTFSYKSARLTEDKWIDVSSFVIDRHADGTPAMLVIGFSLVDAFATIRQELQARLKEDMQLIGGLASGYQSLYFFDIDAGIFKIYSLDGEKYSETKRVVNDGGDPLAMLRAYGMSELIHPDDRHLFRELSIKAVRERLAHSKKFTIRFRRSFHGKYLWQEMDVIKYEDIDEPANAIAAGFADRDAEIRNQQELLRQLEEARNAAEAANKSKTNFLFNMSHDIRTPMNAITGFTSMAIKHIDERDKALDSLNKIQQSGNMLLSLINSVLEVSRIESGHATLDLKPGDVLYSFVNIDTTMLELAATKDIDLSFDIENIRDRFVYCDFSRCMRIFVNVISNAIKYTPEGGTVRVRCEQIGENKDGYATYCYTVSDTGIGMSEEFQKHVFEQFAREKTATVSGIQGTGLGMAVVKSFVDLMGGTIECRSRQGEGTTFTITLPFRIQEGETFTDPTTGEVVTSLTPPRFRPEADFHGKMVLLVEDNELNREIAYELLEEKGLVIEEAEDGTQAVELLRKNGPTYYDFILMDIQMPIMNGYEATAAIRAMYPDAHIPIIAISANAFAEDKTASLAAGMDDHVAKPINPPELFSALEKFL